MIEETKKPGKSHGSGNSSGKYYKVEIRSTHMHKVLQGADQQFVIGKEWREWPLRVADGQRHAAPAIPTRSWDRHAGEHGLLSYEAAVAHQWGALAFLEASDPGGALCIETRLVAVEFKESYSTEEVGVSEPISLPRRPWDAFKDRAVMDAIPTTIV